MLEFLLTLVDENDRHKVEEIYRKYHEIMYKAALAELSSKPNASYKAEEAVQNAFIRIINYFEKIRFTEDERTLKAFFISIVIREANRLYRKKEHISLEELQEKLQEEIRSDEDFVEKLCIKEDYERVKKAIFQLNSQYQAVLFQYFVEEKDGPEIAALFDMKLSTVHTTIWRGKEKLLKILKEETCGEWGK